MLLPADCVEDCVELEPAAERESEEDAEACVGLALAEELGWYSSDWDSSDEAPEMGEADAEAEGADAAEAAVVAAAAEGASSEDLPPPPPRTPPRSPPSLLELVFCEPKPEVSLGEAGGVVAEEASSEDLPPPPRTPPRNPPSWLELVFCEPKPEVSLGEAAGAAADEVGCESASSSGWF